jgi:hypothetical protein
MSARLQKALEVGKVVVTNPTSGEVMLSMKRRGATGVIVHIIPPLAKSYDLTRFFTADELKKSNISEIVSKGQLRID